MPRMSRDGHCEFDGCTEKIKAKRLCQRHYYKYLYPNFSDRPSVALKKKQPKEPKVRVTGQELWSLIEADLKSGKLILN